MNIIYNAFTFTMHLPLPIIITFCPPFKNTIMGNFPRTFGIGFPGTVNVSYFFSYHDMIWTIIQMENFIRRWWLAGLKESLKCRHTEIDHYQLKNTVMHIRYDQCIFTMIIGLYFKPWSFMFKVEAFYVTKKSWKLQGCFTCSSWENRAQSFRRS